MCPLAAVLFLLQVYLEDLSNFPRNPWSLKGLQQVYQKQNTSAAKQKLQKVRSTVHCMLQSNASGIHCFVNIAVTCVVTHSAVNLVNLHVH